MNSYLDYTYIYIDDFKLRYIKTNFKYSITWEYDGDNPIKKDTIPKFMPESYPIYVGQSKDDVFNSLGIKQIMLDIIKMKQDSVGHYLTGDYSENGLSVHVFQKGDYLSLEFCNKLNSSIITIVFSSGVFSELDFYYDYSL